jgi:hypothetical protein
MSKKIIFFIYSSANIMGCIWGLIGLIAYPFTQSTLGNLFLYLTPALYACGYLILIQQTTAEQWTAGNDIAVADLKYELESLIKKISKRVAKPELEKLSHIKENVLLLLPRLEEMDGADYDFHVVKQTVIDYLPQMLTAYLQLPPVFARMHKMRNGKTAQEVLIEQLSILDKEINQIVISVNSQDAEALITQSEFLKAKFADDDNWL